MALPAVAASAPPLSLAQRRRFARHLALPEVADAGQRRLLGARVLVVGAGGLGCASLPYLAAAGVGVIGIADDDLIEESNLQRQTLFGPADLGESKARVAAQRLAHLAPDAQIVVHEQRIGPGDEALVGRYDVVIDGTDNFAARYAINALAVAAGIPDVWASISAFDAQVSVWWPPYGPCYRCVFPVEPPAGAVPSCATGGVLGVLVATAGALQAGEAIKLIIGLGDPLVGRVSTFDSRSARWDEVPVRRHPACPQCAGVIDAPPAGVARHTEDDLVDSGEVTATELAALLEQGAVRVIDVRGDDERAIVRIEGDEPLHLQHFLTGAAPAVLPRDEDLVIYCHAGIRSATALAVLREAGFTRARHLVGGVDAWAREVHPELPRY